VKLLRPLVRILLRYGVSFGEFAEMARWVFVDVADKNFSIDGRKQTISRISVLTGLNRKDVTRLTKINIHAGNDVPAGINRAGRVISGWVRARLLPCLWMETRKALLLSLSNTAVTFQCGLCLMNSSESRRSKKMGTTR